MRELKDILTKVTPIYFCGSEFIEACILDVHFAGDVDFSHCRFRGRIRFDGAVFPGKTYFTYSKFDEDASFNGARFDTDARFDSATFSSYVTFGSDFRSDVWFDRARFQSWVSVSLRNSIRVLFDDAILSSVYLDTFVGAVRQVSGLTRAGSPQARPSTGHVPWCALYRDPCGTDEVRRGCFPRQDRPAQPAFIGVLAR